MTQGHPCGGAEGHDLPIPLGDHWSKAPETTFRSSYPSDRAYLVDQWIPDPGSSESQEPTVAESWLDTELDVCLTGDRINPGPNICHSPKVV